MALAETDEWVNEKSTISLDREQTRTDTICAIHTNITLECSNLEGKSEGNDEIREDMKWITRIRNHGYTETEPSRRDRKGTFFSNRYHRITRRFTEILNKCWRLSFDSSQWSFHCDRSVHYQRAADRRPVWCHRVNHHRSVRHRRLVVDHLLQRPAAVQSNTLLGYLVECACRSLSHLVECALYSTLSGHLFWLYLDITYPTTYLSVLPTLPTLCLLFCVLSHYVHIMVFKCSSIMSQRK